MSDVTEQIDEQELMDLEREEGVEDVLEEEGLDTLEGEFPEPGDEAEEVEVDALTEEELEPEVAEGPLQDSEKRSTGFEWALEQIIQVNADALEQKAKVKEAQARLKDEKETLESIQDELNRLIQEAAKLKSQSEPDPERFPLFDKKRVDGMFPKPEATPPLPAEDFAEHYRRESEKCGLDTLGLKAATLKVLTELGLRTVADYGRKSMAVSEGGSDMTSIKSLTEKRVNEIADAIEAVAETWKAQWDAEHPEAEGPFPEVRELDISELEAAAEEGGHDA
jgi:hypothetical protein